MTCLSYKTSCYPKLVHLSSCLITGFNDFELLLQSRRLFPSNKMPYLLPTNLESQKWEIRHFCPFWFVFRLKPWFETRFEMSSLENIFLHKVGCLPVAIIQFQPPKGYQYIQQCGVHHASLHQKNIWKKRTFLHPQPVGHPSKGPDKFLHPKTPVGGLFFPHPIQWEIPPKLPNCTMNGGQKFSNQLCNGVHSPEIERFEIPMKIPPKLPIFICSSHQNFKPGGANGWYMNFSGRVVSSTCH